MQKTIHVRSGLGSGTGTVQVNFMDHQLTFLCHTTNRRLTIPAELALDLEEALIIGGEFNVFLVARGKEEHRWIVGVDCSSAISVNVQDVIKLSDELKNFYAQGLSMYTFNREDSERDTVNLHVQNQVRFHDIHDDDKVVVDDKYVGDLIAILRGDVEIPAYAGDIEVTRCLVDSNNLLLDGGNAEMVILHHDILDEIVEILLRYADGLEVPEEEPEVDQIMNYMQAGLLATLEMGTNPILGLALTLAKMEADGVVTSEQLNESLGVPLPVLEPEEREDEEVYVKTREFDGLEEGETVTLTISADTFEIEDSFGRSMTFLNSMAGDIISAIDAGYQGRSVERDGFSFRIDSDGDLELEDFNDEYCCIYIDEDSVERFRLEMGKIRGFITNIRVRPGYGDPGDENDSVPLTVQVVDHNLQGESALSHFIRTGDTLPMQREQESQGHVFAKSSDEREAEKSHDDPSSFFHEEDEFDMSNPKDAIGVTKVPMDMLPEVAMIHGSLGMLEGALKYGKHNYRFAPVKASIYIAAAMRHLLKYANGQERDPKTQIRELGSVIANAAILLDAEAHGTLIDDRTQTNIVEDVLAEEMGTVEKLKDLFGRDTRLLPDRQ